MMIPRICCSLMLLLFCLAPLFAQNPPPAGEIKERIIYIPYRQLENLAPSKETGIYLSYQEYRQLLDELEKLKQRPPELPASAVISEMSYQGKVVENFLEVEAIGTLNILKEGWHSVELKFGNIAIKQAKWNDEPALLRWENGGYVLMFQSAQPGKGQLKLNFMVSVQKDAQMNAIAQFFVPRAPIAQLHLEIPGLSEEQESRMKVQVEPSITTDIKHSKGMTSVQALLGNTDQIKIVWQSEAERKVEIKNLVHAENISRLEIGENFLHLQCKVRYDLIQGNVAALQLKLPDGFRILSVNAAQGGTIRDWTLDDTNTLLTVNLHEKIANQGEGRSDFDLDLKLEKMLRSAEEKLALPVLGILDVEREKGFYTIAVSDVHNLKIIERKDISQVDFQDLPDYVSRQDIQFAFKYLKQPFVLQLELEKKEPEYEVITNVYASLDETLYKLYSYFTIDIKKSRIFGAKIEIPTGFVLLDAKAYDLASREKALDQIKEYREISEPDKQILAIVFKKGIKSSSLVIRLHLQKKFAQEEKERMISLPVFKVQGAKRETGNIGLSVKPSFNITTVEKSQKNVFPLDIRELFQQGDRPPYQQVNIGLRYFDHPIAAEFKIEKRDPLITAEVYNYVDIAENVLTHRLHIFYDVKYTGVKEFSFVLPKDIAQHVPQSRITDPNPSGSSIKEISLTPDETAKTVLYTVQIQRDFLGTYELVVVYEKKLDPTLTSQTHEIFDLITQNTKRENGFIVFKKNTNLSLEFIGVKGLENTDINDPMFSRGNKDGVLAIFKYSSHGYQLTMEMKKLMFEPVLNTVIQRLHISTTLNKDFTCKSEAVVLLINNRKQMLEFEVPEGSQVTSVSRVKTMPSVYNRMKAVDLDNCLEPLNWSRTDKPRCFKVSISTNVQKSTPFVLVIKYETTLKKGEMGYSGDMTLTSLNFSDVPITYFTWELGLPIEYQYTWFTSNLHRNFNIYYGLWGVLAEILFNHGLDTTEIKQDAETGVIPIYPIEGKYYSFYRLNGQGYITISYLYNNWLNTLHLLIFLAIAGFFLITAKLQRVALLPLVFLFIAVSILLASLNLQGYQDLYLTVFVATVAVTVIIAIFRFFEWMGQPSTPMPNRIIRDGSVKKEPPSPASPTSKEPESKHQEPPKS